MTVTTEWQVLLCIRRACLLAAYNERVAGFSQGLYTCIPETREVFAHSIAVFTGKFSVNV